MEHSWLLNHNDKFQLSAMTRSSSRGEPAPLPVPTHWAPRAVRWCTAQKPHKAADSCICCTRCQMWNYLHHITFHEHAGHLICLSLPHLDFKGPGSDVKALSLLNRRWIRGWRYVIWVLKVPLGCRCLVSLQSRSGVCAVVIKQVTDRQPSSFWETTKHSWMSSLFFKS